MSIQFHILSGPHLSSQEVNHLRQLSADWNSPRDFWTWQSILESLKDPSYQMWVSEERLSKEWSSFAITRHVDQEAELIYIHTHSKYRGQGLSKNLLTYVIKKLSESWGIKKFFLEVRESNLIGQKLYQACLFKVTSTRKSYYSNGENALIMEKAL